MALTLSLTDGTTTYNLIDDTAYMVRAGTLALGNPTTLQAESANVMATGWNLVAHSFAKRIITMAVRVMASDLDGLGTNVQNLHVALRKARNYQISGSGSQWQLKWNQGGDAKDIYFNIQNGTLAIPANAMNGVRLSTTNPTIPNALLTLECDPLGHGDAETIANYGLNPGFEVAGTALGSWTESKTATGTTGRDTTKRIHGAASLKLVMTDSGVGQQWVARYEDITVVAATTMSVGIYCEYTARANSVAALVYQVLDSGGNVLQEDDDFLESTSVSGTASFLSRTAFTIPTGGVTLRVWAMLRALTADATGTAFFDQLTVVKASSFPTTWVSGKDVKNHYDDDGQAHLNYIDIHDVLGDYPAKVQIKASENEAHTAFWAGARPGGESGRQYDAGLWHEGEDFSAWRQEPSDANQSSASYGRLIVEPQFDAVSTGSGANATTVTVSHVCSSSADRLLVVGVANRDAGASPAAPSGVTYAGAALTKAGQVTSGTMIVSQWYKVAPATGTNNVIVTFADNRHEGITVDNISFTDVDQVTPLGTTGTASGSDNAPTVAVTSVIGELVVDNVGQITTSTNYSAGSGQTERTDHTANSIAAAISTELAAGASTTMSWTAPATAVWGTVSTAVKAGGATAAAPHVFTKSVSSPPSGIYRVLCRARASANTWGFAMGYAYGGVTEDPSVAPDYTSVSSTAFVWTDIGSLVLPPAETPDGATVGTLTLRLAVYRVSGTGNDDVDVDSVMLLPVDFGSAYVSKASATNVVVVDSISRSPHIALWDTSDVFQSRPQQEGTPPIIDPDGTRIYLVSDDGAADIDDGWSVSVRVVPQYMVLG